MPQQGRSAGLATPKIEQADADQPHGVGAEQPGPVQAAIAVQPQPTRPLAPLPPADATSLLDILHRANQVVNQRFASSSGVAGPTPRQLAVLASVAASDGLSQTEISDATGIDRATTAEIVGRLNRLGLIKRRRTRHDARTYAVSLTEKGQASFAEARALSARIEAELLTVLPAGDRSTLVALLNRLVTPRAATKP